jgi:hypothetical protein
MLRFFQRFYCPINHFTTINKTGFLDSAADHFNQLAQSCVVRTNGTTSVS